LFLAAYLKLPPARFKKPCCEIDANSFNNCLVA
jgi:hypothetical protein